MLLHVCCSCSARSRALITPVAWFAYRVQRQQGRLTNVKVKSGLLPEFHIPGTFAPRMYVARAIVRGGVVCSVHSIFWDFGLSERWYPSA